MPLIKFHFNIVPHTLQNSRFLTLASNVLVRWYVVSLIIWLMSELLVH